MYSLKMEQMKDGISCYAMSTPQKLSRHIRYSMQRKLCAIAINMDTA